MFRKLTPAQLTWDLVGAVLLLVLALATTAGVDGRLWHAGGTPFQVTLSLVVGSVDTVVMCIAVAIRRWSPPLALAAAWVSAVLQMAFLLTPGIENLGVFIVLFATSAYGSRRTMWWGLGSAGVGAALASAYMLLMERDLRLLGLGGDSLWATLFLGGLLLVASLASCGLSWAAGLLVRMRLRNRRLEQDRLVAEALAVAEQQRNQIARDMHDVVAHSLAVVIAQADGARYAAAADPTAATDALATIATTARGALGDVRLLLTQLRHSQAEGPQPTLADLEALYAQVRGAGVDLRVDVDPVPRADPPGAVQIAVYRVLQEALTNALRHGDGSGVDVHLAWHPDRVDLGVRNVLGPDGGAPSGGHGLIGMRERAQLVGGRLDAGPNGAHFDVRASIPIQQEDA
ncbi:sensor histidine kinase [Microbacterium gorillae]|uniref:sensor histidine kinase n=1 Tax=Microbacterium gorillae TaxID=1231063 RepID=UPI00058C095F|nr:histidine kinase [Microbacterium gorillae]